MAQSKRVLGTFTLAMITVAAIVSLRNLPLSAEFGFSSIFFLVASAVLFFIPIALVTAELATTFPEAGGSYIWVSRAFNKPLGFFTLWVAWMESIAWFPAILAFTAAMVAHLFRPWWPGLEHQNFFIFSVMLVVFWCATLSNFFGIKLSGWVSSLGVMLGTIIPGTLIILLGLWWIVSGHPTEIELNASALIPDFELENIVIFSGVLLGLAGAELAAFHIREARHPQRDFPRALLIAAFIILFVYILGTLSIAAVVPQQDISLASGLIQAFDVFFHRFHMDWLIPFMALILLIGSLAGINTWTIGPAKGLLVCAQDGFLPKPLTRVNAHGVPTALLILQAVIGSLLALVFLYLDDSSASIWVLTALSAQFTFVQYLLVFFAAVYLRFKRPDVVRPYRVPGLFLVALLGVAICIFGFFIVYIPPAQLNTGDRTVYTMMLVGSFFVLALPPILFAKYKTVAWQTEIVHSQD